MNLQSFNPQCFFPQLHYCVLTVLHSVLTTVGSQGGQISVVWSPLSIPRGPTRPLPSPSRDSNWSRGQMTTPSAGASTWARIVAVRTFILSLCYRVLDANIWHDICSYLSLTVVRLYSVWESVHLWEVCVTTDVVLHVAMWYWVNTQMK